MENENQVLSSEETAEVKEMPVENVEEKILETENCENDSCENLENSEESTQDSPREDEHDTEFSADPDNKPKAAVEVTQEMLDVSSKTLATMFDYLGLDASIRTEGHNSKINLIVSSSETGRIIGRKGQTLEALQLLLNRMMQKNNPDFPKVYIDIDGYSSGNTKRDDFKKRTSGSGRNGGRKSREHSASKDDDRFGNEGILRQQALDAAKEVRKWGEDVTLPQMNAHDRRIVHISLEKEPDLVTESIGEGAKKRVVISLKKQ